MDCRRGMHWRSVVGLDIALVVVYGAVASTIGLKPLLMIGLPICITASAIGGWLFYIQHQFEDGHWRHDEEWDFQTAAIYGSTYYVLPKVLQWFTGNIGLHHIHHLNSMIPNYRLQDCLKACPESGKREPADDPRKSRLRPARAVG